VLGDSHYLSVFTPGQLHALALLFLKINDRSTGIAMVFFGLSTPLTGYLIYKSTFLPRWLGVLGMVAGVGWLSFVYPPLASRLAMVIFPLGILSVLAMVFWFLVYGVDEEKWKAMAFRP